MLCFRKEMTVLSCKGESNGSSETNAG